MDNITRQNQFYESQVIKQENESGYERRPLEMEQQQAYRPGGKAYLLREIESVCGLYPLPKACLPLGQSIWALSLWQGSSEGENLILLPGVERGESVVSVFRC